MGKILVIEDDLVSRKIMVSTVESMGHTAIQASNGKLGLSTLSDNADIELIVTDLMMPELSGQELVKIVRGNKNWQTLPIVMVSGVVALREIVGILELGASRFLPKPIDVKELRSYIELCLKSARQGAGSTDSSRALDSH